ncbi:glycosyltransferase family 4 protein [Afifella sp. IM 167]|uniref:glycosyltransferase family 4 protein n=1 Tax=Afifella sp. IM 167 TaxID=2033586 RepID=UPI001CCE991E|nr:glycosyltransferase family 4 protein [Afifella sp. IM 167]
MADRPLRLLLWYWGRRGGGPRYTMELARELKRRGDIDLYLSLSRQSELFAEADALGLPSFHVDTYRDMTGFALGSLRLPFLRHKLVRFLRENRIDVVYNTMDFLWGSALAPAIGRAGSKYLLAVHDAARHPGEEGKMRDILLRRDIGAADGIVTMTQSVRERLLSLYDFPPERTWSVPLGIHLDAAAASPRALPADRPVRVLFFGRILPYKGLDILLAAMARLEAEGRPVTLEIWGAGNIGEYRDALAGLKSVRIENRWIEENEFGGIFERADICALSYREASQSGVIAASVAAGVPVVTTPIGGLVEQIDGGAAGVVASGFSGEDFAAALKVLLDDPQAYERASAHGLRLASTRFSWEHITDELAAIARKLHSDGRKVGGSGAATQKDRSSAQT